MERVSLRYCSACREEEFWPAGATVISGQEWKRVSGVGAGLLGVGGEGSKPTDELWFGIFGGRWICGALGHGCGAEKRQEGDRSPAHEIKGGLKSI